jgi:hypothetical protein
MRIVLKRFAWLNMQDSIRTGCVNSKQAAWNTMEAANGEGNIETINLIQAKSLPKRSSAVLPGHSSNAMHRTKQRWKTFISISRFLNV